MKTALLTLSLVLAACGSAESTGSDAPKTDPSAPASKTVAATEGPRWITPDGWNEEEVTKAMRYKQYSLPGVDGEEDALCVVASWPGGVGPMEINLDRWVGQVSGPDSTLKARDLTEDQRWTMELDGYHLTNVHVEGTIKPMEGMASDVAVTDAGAILASFIEVVGSPATWTVKVTGPSKTVASHKDRFLQFISGI